MALATGQVLNERYRIVSLLGQGGFGAVYRAWDLALKIPCALKENFDSSPEAQKQFEREAIILAKLSHPGLPRVTDHFTITGQGQYLVMDFVDGQDLQTLLEKQAGPLDVNQVLPWIDQVCDALDYLHSQTPPIIHRDIKPANIRITPEGKAVLVDFGIAKVYDPKLKTTSGARAFTPGYSPPEQYGQGGTDSRTDVYALGATLYTLLSGVVPADSVDMLASTHPPPDPLATLNPGVSPEVDAAVRRAMQLNRDRRFQSAANFKASLHSSRMVSEKFQTHKVTPEVSPTHKAQSGPIPLSTPTSELRALPKWLLWVGGLVILVLLVILGPRIINPPFSETLTLTPTAGLDDVLILSITPETATITPASPEVEVTPPTISPSPTATLMPTLSPSPEPVSSWQQGKLVFVLDNGSSRALYTLDLAAGGEPELLIDPGSGTWFLAPAWSPDGSQIAYHQYGGAMQVVNAGGGAYPRSLHTCTVASWSRDGSQILCESSGVETFVIVDANSGDLVRTISMESGAMVPSWSPLGGKMAYAVNDNGQFSVWTSALDGSQDTLVAGESSENYAPAWSPDGGRIAYQSRQNSSLSEIWVSDPDGRNKQRLTFTPDGYWSRAPAWSPDGKWLVFVSNQDASSGGEQGEIYVVSLLTGDLFRVTNTGGAVYNWRVSWGQ